MKALQLLLMLVVINLGCNNTKESKNTKKEVISKNTAPSPKSNNINCGQLISDLVKSSNAAALRHFNDTALKVQIAYMTAEKATIKLYVVNDISETPAEKRLTEQAVGWLEFHRKSGQLLDITNDPDKPLVLKYDKAILGKHDLFKLCSSEAAIAKPGTGYESRDVMLESDIRFNGKLKRFFTLDEFAKVFGKPDSIQLLKDEAPCITIFDTEAPDDKYLYKSGSRFETSKEKVAVDEFWFRDGNFITYKGIRIDAHTTMNDMRQLFPTAINERLGMDKEGKLWVIQLREDHKGISDGHIKIFFRDGKISFMHWWFPC
jgi:hypothetical protein